MKTGTVKIGSTNRTRTVGQSGQGGTGFKRESTSPSVLPAATLARNVDSETGPFDEQNSTVFGMPSRHVPATKRICSMQTSESMRAISEMTYPKELDRQKAKLVVNNRENRKANLMVIPATGSNEVGQASSGIISRDRVVTMHSQPTSRYRLQWMPTHKKEYHKKLQKPPPVPLKPPAGTENGNGKSITDRSDTSASLTAPIRNGTTKLSIHTTDRSISSSSSTNSIKGKGAAAITSPEPVAVATAAMSPRHDVTIIGPPHLRIFRWSLPSALLPLFDPIISRCEEYSKSRSTGWNTNLYSLTRQDIPLALVPGGVGLTQSLTDLIVQQAQRLYHTEGEPMRSITLDANQPHILKYDAKSHAGVRLHYDRCDVTVQCMLSSRRDYEGGGTLFPDANASIMLEQGEVLMHPGNLVHSGLNISKGTRYLLIWFCQFA